MKCLLVDLNHCISQWLLLKTWGLALEMEIPTFKSIKKSFVRNFKSVTGNFVNTNLLIAQQACMLLLNTCCKLCFLSLLYAILFSFCSLPCLKSNRQGYVVVFMQSILSVDNFQGKVVSIFTVDWCRPQKFVCRNILLDKDFSI